LTADAKIAAGKAGVSSDRDYLALLARVHAYARGVAPGLAIG
jgi:hypothetical protein